MSQLGVHMPFMCLRHPTLYCGLATASCASLVRTQLERFRRVSMQSHVRVAR